jgi:hypothetical protein
MQIDSLLYTTISHYTPTGKTSLEPVQYVILSYPTHESHSMLLLTCDRAHKNGRMPSRNHHRGRASQRGIHRRRHRFSDHLNAYTFQYCILIFIGIQRTLETYDSSSSGGVLSVDRPRRPHGLGPRRIRPRTPTPPASLQTPRRIVLYYSSSYSE